MEVEMIEAYSLQTGRTTIDLKEVVEYCQTLQKVRGKWHWCTNIVTRYNSRHTLLVAYDEFQEIMEAAGMEAVKTF
jgi:hypothetical protein